MLYPTSGSAKSAGNAKPQRRPLLPALLIAVGAACPATLVMANPTLPTIGSGNFNVSVSDSAIGTSAVIETGTTSTVATNNTTVINDYLAYAAAQGGGTVVIPTGTYDADELLLTNNVDLDIQTGATLQNFETTNTFVTAASGTTGNVEISGGGILNNAATGTSNNKMVMLDGLNNVEVTNVTIENAPNEHLVSECCNNVTYNNVTINDSKIQANTDGIDFSGTNYLIENCNIADGDDDIVAKPNTDVFNGITAYTANVVINNCTITDGHGISIGGQTNAGLNGMYVNSCTLDGVNTTSNGEIATGLHLKAGDGNNSTTANGGPVTNVTFNNITMTNVDDAIVIDSYYQNGNNFPGIPAPAAPTDSTEPTWSNITFENITVNNATGSAAEIYGLNSTPPDINGLNIENVNVLESDSPWKMYYASGVYFQNVTVGGANLPDSEGDVKNPSGSMTESDEQFDEFNASASPIYVPAVPEPASISLISGMGVTLMGRRRRRKV
jgi:polygalacturonase